MSAPVVAVLHNLEAAFTGNAGHALLAAGAIIDERRLRDGDPLPALDAVDGIVALGGEQSVTAIAADPTLQAEADLLRAAVERDVPTLGVCLGAQLLAYALGGSVARLRDRWLAWTPLEPLPAAAGDPLFGALPAGAMGLHWNEDGFEPPPGAVELLRRPGPSGEAFRYGDSAWAVQFHPEVDDAAVDGWYPRLAGRARLGGRRRGRRARGRRPPLPAQRALSARSSAASPASPAAAPRAA